MRLLEQRKKFCENFEKKAYNLDEYHFSVCIKMFYLKIINVKGCSAVKTNKEIGEYAGTSHMPMEKLKWEPPLLTPICKWQMRQTEIGFAEDSWPSTPHTGLPIS